jgi:hypothetical protein
MSCVYLREASKCLRRSEAACCNCPTKLTIDDPKFLETWRDPLEVIDRNRNPAGDVLRNLLAGSSVFLLCGGPSANDLPLEDLGRRGIWTMAVNNAAGHSRVRPQAFVCADPPMKFSHSIWLDPAIMKFVPTPKLCRGRRAMRQKLSDGTWQWMKDRNVGNSPNVWGFKRNSWLNPDDSFFLDDGTPWGNHASGVERTGQPKTVCTMLLAIRLLRFLGAHRVYLVGVDFRMTPETGYSFGQGRTQEACDSNNRQFSVISGWLTAMQEKGVFARFGMDIYNCYERSGLRAFPFVPFEEAVADCQGLCEESPDLVGWYEKA